MTRTIVALSLAPAFFAGARVLAQAPIAVHVTAAREVPKIDHANRETVRKELEAKARATYDAMKAFKAQHGQKKDAWPPEKQAAFQELEDDHAEAEAALAYLGLLPRGLTEVQEGGELGWAPASYRDISPKGLADSAQDIRDSLTGKKGTAGAGEYAKYVNAPELADILVEVVGRRGTTGCSWSSGSLCYVAFRITAGPNFDATRLGKVPPKYVWTVPPKYAEGDFRRRSLTLHTWSAHEPYITLEASAIDDWVNVGNVVAALINTFLKDNYAALTGK